jgi:hypothetical protein
MNIATHEKAAQHLNAGEIDAAVDTLFAPMRSITTQHRARGRAAKAFARFSIPSLPHSPTLTSNRR